MKSMAGRDRALAAVKPQGLGLSRQIGRSNLLKEVDGRRIAKKDAPKGLEVKGQRKAVDKKNIVTAKSTAPSFDIYMDDVDENKGVEKREKSEKDVKRVPLGQILPKRHDKIELKDDVCYAEAASSYDSAHEELHSEYLSAQGEPCPSGEELLHNYHLTLPDFSRDMYKYMRMRERMFRPKANYMTKQSDITMEMRSILIDWLNDVTVEYKLHTETLHIAVSIIDRVLSLCAIDRMKLQLVGTTAMMIASKYEEIYPPELSDFVYVTDDTYTSAQILKMERTLLRHLRFNVSVPTPTWFVHHFATVLEATQRTRHAATYLVDLALMDTKFLQYVPSVVAASAVCLANILTGPSPWSSTIEELSGIRPSDMKECLIGLLTMFSEAPSDSKHKSIFDKYSSSHFDAVAKIPPPSSFAFS